MLFELTPEELYVFDEFEGEEYYKAGVQPELLEGAGAAAGDSAGAAGRVEADAYLWQDALRPALLPSAWDPEGFRQQHLARYTVMCQKFAASLCRRSP